MHAQKNSWQYLGFLSNMPEISSDQKWQGRPKKDTKWFLIPLGYPTRYKPQRNLVKILINKANRLEGNNKFRPSI